MVTYIIHLMVHHQKYCEQNLDAVVLVLLP